MRCKVGYLDVEESLEDIETVLDTVCISSFESLSEYGHHVGHKRLYSCNLLLLIGIDVLGNLAQSSKGDDSDTEVFGIVQSALEELKELRKLAGEVASDNRVEDAVQGVEADLHDTAQVRILDDERATREHTSRTAASLSPAAAHSQPSSSGHCLGRRAKGQPNARCFDQTPDALLWNFDLCNRSYQARSRVPYERCSANVLKVSFTTGKRGTKVDPRSGTSSKPLQQASLDLGSRRSGLFSP